MQLNTEWRELIQSFVDASNVRRVGENNKTGNRAKNKINQTKSKRDGLKSEFIAEPLKFAHKTNCKKMPNAKFMQAAIY